MTGRKSTEFSTARRSESLVPLERKAFYFLRFLFSGEVFVFGKLSRLVCVFSFDPRAGFGSFI